MIDIITPSGDRPLQFSFCVEWMSKQNFFEPVHWIIVDDSTINNYYETPKMPNNWKITHIKVERKTLPNHSTQADNILKAIDHIIYDKVIMIEDDDYYHPEWLVICNHYLDYCDIFGKTSVIYYNLKNKTFWNKPYPNNDFNPMVQTAFTRAVIPNLKKVCSNNINLLDYYLWMSIGQNKKFFLQTNSIEYVVGMKGLSGRGGMTKNHTTILPSQDYNLLFLKNVLGENVFKKYKTIL